MNNSTRYMFSYGFMGNLREAVRKDFMSVAKYYVANGESFENFFGKDKYYAENGLANIKWPKLDGKLSNPLGINDFENSRKLHKALREGGFPNSLALDERLWSWLAHTFYRDYVLERWFSAEFKTEEKFQTRVEGKFFFSGAPQMRHSLARLYWIAEMTFDEGNKADPYWLTRTAFMNQGQADDFIERNVGRNPKVVKAAMRAIEFNSKLISEKGGLGKAIEKTSLALNEYAALVIIDTLTQDELNKFLNTELIKALEQ